MSEFEFTALLPEGWERPRVYSHGVVSVGGRRVQVAGQTGTQEDAPGDVPGGSFGAQFGRSLGRVVQVMASAGGGAEHITAMRLYVPSL